MNTQIQFPSRHSTRDHLLLLALSILLLPLGSQAQPATSPSSKSSTEEGLRTAYLVRSAEAFPVVLTSARTSLARNGEDTSFTAAAADVVVVGPAVRALAASSDQADTLRQSLDANVRVVACEIAMEKAGVSPGDLVEGVDTVPNGFHELFRLQSNGYQTLQL